MAQQRGRLSRFATLAGAEGLGEMLEPLRAVPPLELCRRRLAAPPADWFRKLVWGLSQRHENCYCSTIY